MDNRPGGLREWRNDVTIWKFPLSMIDLQTIRMPKDATILSVALQEHMVCLWVMVDPNMPPEERNIEIIGTGQPVCKLRETTRRFVGTVLVGQFVWHVFDIQPA